MKKLLATAVVTAMIASLGAAFAQTTQRHDVEVRIPNVLMIRLTSGNSNAAVGTPGTVVFNLPVGFEPEGTFTTPTFPTLGVGDAWDNVRVFANGGGWRVTVATNNNAFGDTLGWGRVRVTPSGGDHTPTSFTLPSSTSAQFFSDTARTGGWDSLGFGPAQFSLTLDGTEAAGTYITTVTYTILFP